MGMPREDLNLVAVSHPTFNTPRVIALGLGAAGVIGLGIGSWAGLDARASRNDARALGCNDDLSRCPSPALGTANSAFSRAQLSTAFLAASGALITTGAVVWLVAPAPGRKQVRLQPTIESGGIGMAMRVEL